MTATTLLDVNVLLALSWDQHVHHELAHARFHELDRWSTTPATEAGLLRLLLTESVVGRRVSGQEALGQLMALRAVSGWSMIADTATLADPLIDMRILMGRRQVTDLQLVNLAATQASTLTTFDADIRESLIPDERHWVNVWL